MSEALAIYGATNASYGLAKDLIKIVESWIAAVDEAKAVKISFDFAKSKLEIYRAFFEKNEKSVVESLSVAIRAATTDLNASLTSTLTKIDKYDPKTWRRTQWPWVRGSLMQAEQALSSWEQRLSNTFIYLEESLQQDLKKRFSSSEYRAKADPMAALREHVEMRKRQSALRTADIEQLLQSLAKEPINNEVERRFYWKDLVAISVDTQSDENQLKDAKVEIAKLAEVLKGGNSKLTYIPKATCWFQHSSDEYGIAYQIPTVLHVWPQMPQQTPTLKAMVTRPAEHPLNDRIELAIQIVSAVSYIHGLEWVHKSIRSENVLLVYQIDSRFPPYGLGKANLVGFGISRRSVGRSMYELANITDWKSQIYSHPDRQTVNIPDAEETFYGKDVGETKSLEVMLDSAQDQHSQETVTQNLQEVPIAGTSGSTSMQDQITITQGDLLSPTSSVNRTATEADPLPWETKPTRQFYKYKHDIYSVGAVLLELGCWLDLSKVDSLKHKSPEDRRTELLKIASGQLPRTMGQRYSDIVKACLNVDDSKKDIQQVLNDLYDIRL